MKKTSQKLSVAQCQIVELLSKDPKAYVLATVFYDFQQVVLSDGSIKYFKKSTREVLVRLGVIMEFEPDKFRLKHKRITVYERLQHYATVPGSRTFSNTEIKKISRALASIYDKGDYPPIEYVESIENGTTYSVRAYPTYFKRMIDSFIWKFHKKRHHKKINSKTDALP